MSVLKYYDGTEWKGVGTAPVLVPAGENSVQRSSIVDGAVSGDKIDFASYMSAFRVGMGGLVNDGASVVTTASSMNMTVEMNVGNDYSSGQYVCPVDGIYLFSLNYTFDNINSGGSGGARAQVDLKKNGTNIGYGSGFVHEFSTYDLAANVTTTINCNAGDVISGSVYMQGSGNKYIQSPQSSFSGHLIAPITV